MLSDAGSGTPGGLMIVPASVERSSKLPRSKLLLAINVPAGVLDHVA